MKKILKLINAIKASNENAEYIYTNGVCYNFALILRSVFVGEICYSRVEGHVWFKHDGKYYDINGLCLNPPKDIEVLDHMYGHRPHRWCKSHRRDHALVSTRNIPELKKEDILKNAWDENDLETWIKTKYPDLSIAEETIDFMKQMSIWNTKFIHGDNGGTIHCSINKSNPLIKTEYGWLCPNCKVKLGKHLKPIDLEFYIRARNGRLTWSSVFGGVLVS